MIPDYGRYYGCLFVRLAEARPRIEVQKLEVGVQGFYLLDERLPLYIKFSRQRKGPWGFTFQADHQVCCAQLVRRFGNCVTALVCGHDGIVALSDTQLREVLDDQFDTQEGVTVRRKLRHMYSVTGSNGKLSRKVSRDSLVEIIEALLPQEKIGPERGQS